MTNWSVMVAAIFIVNETSVGSMLPNRGTSLLPGKTLFRFEKSAVSSGGQGVNLVMLAKARGFATGIARRVPLILDGTASSIALRTTLLW